MAANGRHLAKKAEYGTVPWIIEGNRRVLGGAIDLDPASSPQWNQIVRARRFLTKRDNALRCSWGGPGLLVHLNPPGDPSGSLVPHFWYRVQAQQAAGMVSAAVWVGFSIEQFCTLQGVGARHPLDLPTVILRQRVPYNEIVRGRIVPTTSPSHASYLTLLPPQSTLERRAMVARFAAEYGTRGKLINCGG